MILLWKEREMPDDAYHQWTHSWKTFATKHGEELMAAYWDENHVQKAWDCVSRTHGRYVIWARPGFIPNISMFSELDYLLNQGVRIVAQRLYNCAFAQGHEDPVLWEPAGVDSSLLVFQLNGQERDVLPPAALTDIWAWLDEPRKNTFIVPQRFSGACGRKLWASRSILGETIYSPFRPTKPGLPFTQERQLAAWREQMQVWNIWLTSKFSD